MKAVLRSFHQLAPEVRHFDFEVPEVTSLPFLPGQWVSFVHEIQGKEITRAYSICSPPDGNRFSLCLNLVHDGHLSPFLFSLQVGESVDMTGPPLGTFTIRHPHRDKILVATGTGIAPFRSIILNEAGRDHAYTTLIFGVRYEENLLYRSEWEAIRDPRFDFRPTLSRPLPSWPGRTGHVQPHLLEAIGNRRDLDVYVCGLELMVDDVRAQLKALGFDRRQIVYEKYD